MEFNYYKLNNNSSFVIKTDYCIINTMHLEFFVANKAK